MCVQVAEKGNVHSCIHPLHSEEVALYVDIHEVERWTDRTCKTLQQNMQRLFYHMLQTQVRGDVLHFQQGPQHAVTVRGHPAAACF